VPPGARKPAFNFLILSAEFLAEIALNYWLSHGTIAFLVYSIEI
jgi:hypothetical protein